MSLESVYKQRCEAMVKAGIEDPESVEGNKFCTDHCPYDCCVVFESPSQQILDAQEREALARALWACGVSRYDIALIVGRTKNTVDSYLRKR